MTVEGSHSVSDMEEEAFRSRSVTRKTRMYMFQVIVMYVILHGAETWEVTQKDSDDYMTSR